MDPFDQLMTIAREVFAAGRYNVAYHALAAALHWAEAEGNEERLLTVEREVRGQLTEIDRHTPQYEHSTASAKARGHESIFMLLSRQASAKEAGLRQRREHSRRRLSP